MRSSTSWKTRQRPLAGTRPSIASPERVALWLLALAIPGCDACQNQSTTCDPACSVGFVCDTDTRACVSDALPSWTQPPPARGLRLTQVGAGAYLAALDPGSRSIVFGPATQNLDLRVLGTDVRPGSRHLAMDSSSERTGVVWIGADGAFVLATRPDTNSAWTTESVRSQETYTPTDDFDFAWTPASGAFVVFRDVGTNTLRSLERAAGQTTWTLSSVDDGRQLGRLECPDEVRARRQRGLGIEPDLLRTNQGMALAYHDADCGDLRLARRADGALTWAITLVDGRDDIANPGSLITGRFPSLAQDSAGNLGIAYQDLARGRLLFAQSRGALGFELETVDRGEALATTSQRTRKIVGAFAAISFDARDRPLITYFDATDGDLVRARRSSDALSTWDIKALASDGLIGWFAHHVRLPGVGIIAGAERLTPGPEGMTSSLVLVSEEEAL